MENNFFTEMCSGSKEGSYLRLIDFVYHSTLSLRVIIIIKGFGVHSSREGGVAVKATPALGFGV